MEDALEQRITALEKKVSTLEGRVQGWQANEGQEIYAELIPQTIANALISALTRPLEGNQELPRQGNAALL